MRSVTTVRVGQCGGVAKGVVMVVCCGAADFVEQAGAPDVAHGLTVFAALRQLAQAEVVVVDIADGRTGAAEREAFAFGIVAVVETAGGGGCGYQSRRRHAHPAGSHGSCCHRGRGHGLPSKCISWLSALWRMACTSFGLAPAARAEAIGDRLQLVGRVVLLLVEDDELVAGGGFLDDPWPPGRIIADPALGAVGAHDAVQAAIGVPVVGGGARTAGGIELVDDLFEAAGLPVGVFDMADAACAASGR